ncbi:MAG: hypothetical protein ABJN22_02870 [Litorimonas sp.]
MNLARNTSNTDISFNYENGISLQELKQGMVNAARLVRRYGAIYWPIVERLQHEINAIEKRDALLAKLLDGDLKSSNEASFG